MTSDRGYMNCPCCKLRQPQAVEPTTGVSARVCTQCTHHQGHQDAKRLKRAETHETMLRERLEACRASEARARATAGQAAQETREARDATAAALQSRSRLADRIINADGPADLQAIARDPQLIQWAKRADDHWANRADNESVLPLGWQSAVRLVGSSAGPVTDQ